MFSFTLNEIKSLAEASTLIGGIDDMVDLKFTPEMFFIMADSSTATDCVIALDLSSHYFDQYVCHLDLQYSWIYCNQFFPHLFDLTESGFSSLTFTMNVHHRAEILFESPNGDVREFNLELVPSHDTRDVGPFDCTPFVSMESQQFVEIITEYHIFDDVLVTVTSSQVKFSHSIVSETILTSESEDCIIGGITAPNQIQFMITLYPMEIFYEIARQTKRVWLFKSNDSSKGVISAPLGLNSRFLAYFPPPMC